MCVNHVSAGAIEAGKEHWISWCWTHTGNCELSDMGTELENTESAHNSSLSSPHPHTTT